MSPAPRSPTTPPAQAAREAVRALCAGASFEMSTRDLDDLPHVRPWLPAHAQISITALPRDRPDEVVRAAARLREAGYEPVPHIAARRLKSADDLHRLLTSLAQRAGVRRVLLVGGDVPQPKGPYACGLDVLQAGVLAAAGMTQIGLAAYPEGHPTINAQTLERSFRDKAQAAREQGLQVFAITQLCFDAAPILALLTRLRASGFGGPLSVGLAGPASLPTLLRFARVCGVGDSARAIVSRGASIARLLSEAGPDPIIRDLAESEATARLQPLSLHFFPFGGLARTSRWVAALAAGRFEFPNTQSGIAAQL